MPELRVGYVLKVYPRLSETFILNEILAHESAGLPLEIVSLRTPSDRTTHADVARVRAEVHCTHDSAVSADEFGAALREAGERLDPEDATLSTANPKQAWTIWQAVRVARVARRQGITHLHAHFATEAATAARLAARLAGIPFSFTAHAKDIFHEDVDEAELRRCVRQASVVVTVSDFNVAHLRGRLGADADRVVRVYNGIDTREFAYSAAPRDPNLVVAVGRLVEKKGFDVLVQACAEVARRGRAIRCVIIGEGEHRAALGRLIEGHGLTDRVTLAGPLPREQVRDVVRRAAALCAPCVVGADGNRDGLPTVLLEALALGTPAISTPVTGIPEIVRDGETGLLVPERDPAALADAMVEILDNPTRARCLARAGRLLVESDFDLHANTRAMRALFTAIPSPVVRGPFRATVA